MAAIATSVAATEQENSRYLNNNTLLRVEYTLVALHDPNLSALATEYLCFFVACVRLGYAGLRAHAGAIAHAQSRASAGRARSERSLYRALAELEGAGYIQRRKFLSYQLQKCVIDFVPAKFVYYAQKTTKTIAPVTTLSHYYPPLPTCHPLKLTSNNTTLQEKVYSLLDSNKSKNHANKNKTGDGADRYRHWQHPVLYTLMCVLRCIIDCDLLIARARRDRELANGNIIDWAHWTPSRWQSLLIAERESYARDVFVPALRFPPVRGAVDDIIDGLTSTPAPTPTPTPTRTEYLADLRADLRAARQDRSSDDISDNDMLILLAAKKRTEERG